MLKSQQLTDILLKLDFITTGKNAAQICEFQIFFTSLVKFASYRKRFGNHSLKPVLYVVPHLYINVIPSLYLLRYVAHTVGPRYNVKYKTAAESALYMCYRNVLGHARYVYLILLLPAYCSKFPFP